jgi:PAS domain S-box-containing protein
MFPLASLATVMAATLVGDDLFDTIPDTVYFIKDSQGRYTAVNQTLVERTGVASKEHLLGRTADEVFPVYLGRRIADQDRSITLAGETLVGELELHLYANGREGWCLTWKTPLRDDNGVVVGLFGMSRDVRAGHEAPEETQALSDVLSYARANLDKPLRVADLAARASLSPFQFDQRLRHLFGMSAGQYITRLRIDLARARLAHSDMPISEIAIECGYADQTALSRQFRKIVQLSPHRYRKLAQHRRSWAA